MPGRRDRRISTHRPARAAQSRRPMGYRRLLVTIIIIIVQLRTRPDGHGAAIYILWASGPYLIFVSPVSPLAVSRGPPLLSPSFFLHCTPWCVPPGVWQFKIGIKCRRGNQNTNGKAEGEHVGTQKDKEDEKKRKEKKTKERKKRKGHPYSDSSYLSILSPSGSSLSLPHPYSSPPYRLPAVAATLALLPPSSG